MSNGKIHVDDLTVDQRRSLGIKVRQQTFTLQDVRRHAFKVLAVLAELEQNERERVLKHALKINKV
jgi:hypothetical protein